MYCCYKSIYKLRSSWLQVPSSAREINMIDRDIGNDVWVGGYTTNPNTVI